MYRVMLYCTLFYLPLNLDDIDSMEDEPGVLDRIKKARRAHLDEYVSQELFELRAAGAFLHELIKDVLDADDFDRLKDICLATGPAVILKAHKAKSSSAFEDALEVEVMSSGEDNALFGGFLAAPIAAICPPTPIWDALLDDAQGHSEPCTQCGGVAVLWKKSNWKRLINVDFCALLLGNLNENEVETAALLDLFMADKGRCSSDVVIAEIYDMRTADLCSACVNRLVGAHLHLWLFKRKVADGWTPTQNCWYGYNCKTQLHKRDHAKSKNHLCAPIR
ncbi:hypothetical protein GGX14DRAFT_485414 [Mycena pura]|uniref:Aprataxin and PNK-like factor PBZ domain-containing protein n=1 Tax=Mycena pura TaxID=153505 RepID=A0AAD6ULN8_9AGAR|nr:hypothetical protein GGX14DRAFT_485414 [Mycena pura]